MHRHSSVLAIVGPTATGKTALSVALAQRFGLEILSADSRYLYRGLDIGTAKPSMAERCGVPHHLIDLLEPTEESSAARYAAAATPLLEQFLARQTPPLVVGGTGFYIRSLLYPGQIPPVAPNPQFRESLNAVSTPDLYARLQQQDPRRAQQLYTTDRFRIIRALEIVHTLGTPVPQTTLTTPYPVRTLGLAFEDRHLHATLIRQRLDAMVRNGFIEEVEALLSRYAPTVPALRSTHGYPEIIQVLHGTLSLTEALDQIALNILHYSKRQMTWFRKTPEIHWIAVDNQPIEIVTHAALCYFMA